MSIRNNTFSYYILFLLVLTGFSLSSCKKFIEVDDPVNSANASIVYNTDAQAIGVLTGIYAKLNKAILPTGNLPSISFFAGLSADELSLFDISSTSLAPYYANNLSAQTSPSIWTTTYPIIFTANSALEGLNTATGLTPAVKQQLTGEAKFIRAFCYFYLVNLYGDVPLALSPDYKVNSLLPRTPKEQVYHQIIADLKDANDLLSSSYLNGSLKPYAGGEEKLRPTKWAATALLGRTYLYTGKFDSGELQATIVIANTSFSLDSLNGVFLKNSKEAIWQIQPVFGNPYYNTLEGGLFVLPSTGPAVGTYPVYLNNSVFNAFETGDQRKQKWVSSITTNIAGTPTTFYYPFKYKAGRGVSSVSEYSMILRLGEVYLIRAEARAQQGNTPGALSDLNAIRNRAGLPDYSGPTDRPSLITAILHERQVELFTEWGHRWLDLKRTGNINAVMSSMTPAKGGTWETRDQLYPVPQSEILNSPNVIQNPGYN
jgi:hypothetical protein